MVLFFDSGIGGKSIEEAFKRACPDCTTAYISDAENLPYGDKTDDFILESVHKLVNNFVNKSHSVDCLVVACNTASTLVLDSLRSLYSFPIVGVVPAIKPAAALSKSGHVALLATEATAFRAYTGQLIDDFASSSQVYRFTSHALVHLAESYYTNPEAFTDWELVEVEIAVILEQEQIDTVVLACTHFSHFKAFFEGIAPEITWVDSVDAVIRQINKVLSLREL